MRRRRHSWVALAATIVAAGFAASAGSGRPAAEGTLDLNATLALTSVVGSCDLVGPAADGCAARTITGQFPGLGRVSGSYAFQLDLGQPSCRDDSVGKALGYPFRLSVAGKGEITLAVTAAPQCDGAELVRTQTQQFTVAGGTGLYAGASGAGRLERILGEDTGTGRHGRETLTGTLVVPGVDFDLVPPRIAGAKNVNVRAPKQARTARVVYRVTAADDRDRAVPAACTPRSGTRFTLGRTQVTCTAFDASGNGATATFVVRVRP